MKDLPKGATKRCQECGGRVPSQAHYCIHCGGDLWAQATLDLIEPEAVEEAAGRTAGAPERSRI